MTVEPPPADGQSSIPDEVWEQFLNDTEGRIRASAPREPSARARVVAARLRRRAEGQNGEHRENGENGGNAALRRPSGRSALRPWIGLVVLAVLVLAALNPSAIASWLTGRRTTASPAPQTAPRTAPRTAQRTAAPSPGPGVPTASHPFAGSPAERWASGPDGIVPPPARAVGALSTAQVAAALQLTRSFLIASNLDPAELGGGRPQTAIDLIDPQETTERGRMETALRTPGADHDAGDFFTRYDPTRLTLVGGAPRAHGRMTFKEGPDRSVEVLADYTFVYAFTRAGDGSGEVARSIVRRTLDAEFDDPARPGVTPGTLWVVESNGSIDNTDCRYHDGFLRPSFPGEQPAVQSSGTPLDPYDSTRPVGADRSCRAVTRT